MITKIHDIEEIHQNVKFLRKGWTSLVRDRISPGDRTCLERSTKQVRFSYLESGKAKIFGYLEDLST
jgi:hypothetical protein